MTEASADRIVRLTLRALDPRALRPHAAVLAAGRAARIGRRRGVHLVVHAGGEESAGEVLGVRHVERHPEARRLLVPLADAALGLVVLGTGEAPAGPPGAWRIGPGEGVVLAPGVWHAGPFPLAGGAWLEGLEVVGAADRLDRVPLRTVLEAEALELVRPESPGAPAPGLDLDLPGAVVVEDGLRGPATWAFLVLEDLLEETAGVELEAALHELAAGLRSVHGADARVADLPGVAPLLELQAALGLDPAVDRPPPVALLERVLGGAPVPRADPLTDALRLHQLRRLQTVAAFDLDAVGDRIQVRRGRPGEALLDGEGRRVDLEGRPCLTDGAVPIGSTEAAGARCSVREATRRALLVLTLPAARGPLEAGVALDELARTVGRHAGGREAGRLVVPSGAAPGASRSRSG